MHEESRKCVWVLHFILVAHADAEDNLREVS